MTPQTFTAGTLQDAIVQVRESFGANAKIISWRKVRGGIEVTAMGASKNALKIEREAENYSLQMGTAPRYDVFAHEEELAKKSNLPLNNLPNNKENNSKKGIEIIAKPKAKPLEKSFAKPQNNVQRNNLEAVGPSPKIGSNAPNIKRKIHPLIPLLVKSGLELRQLKPFAKYFDNGDNLSCLINILDCELEFAPIDAVPKNIIALFGNAGSGKTIGCAKLAARVLAANGRALLISTDTERQGGAGQLSGLAQKLGAEFEFADNLSHARNLALRAHSDGICVFIDCPSANIHDPSSIRFCQKIKDDIGAIGVLCLNADARSDDLTDNALAFKEIGIDSCILTRFDLTNRRAGVLPALLASKMKVAQISPSPYIAGGLALGTAKRLAQLILEPFA